MRLRTLRAGVLLAFLLATVASASAQNQRETQKQLEKVRTELKTIAQERRKLEGQRGDASRKLRDADEQVGRSSRSLSETEASLRREEAALTDLQQQRETLRSRLQGQQAQLAALVRAAYLNGEEAPLKVLLSQDRIADAGRVLAYHRYVQRDRSERIAGVTAELRDLERVEQEITARRAALDAERTRQRSQVSQLQRDRKQRAQLVADLDERYQDRSEREKALGQDARSLEKLLNNLRAAAARAEAERRAAARRAAEEKARAARTGTPRPTEAARQRSSAVANAPAIKVGGLGWPVSGTLLARFGGRMPDGRTSSGVLIGAPTGSTISAVADGTVVFSEWMTGYGLILIVDHGNGYMSLYAHNESLLRDTGDRVKRGDPIGKVGTSGGQGTPALYFELRRNGQPVDPGTWLQRR